MGNWVTGNHTFAGTSLRVRARHEATSMVFKGCTSVLLVTASLKPRRDLTTVFVDMPMDRARHLQLHIEFLGPQDVLAVGDVEGSNTGTVECRTINLPCPQAVQTNSGFWSKFSPHYRYVPSEYRVSYRVDVDYNHRSWEFAGDLVVPTVYPWPDSSP
jgi:hypothetical protein